MEIEEWKKSNPGKSLNEFYSENRSSSKNAEPARAVRHDISTKNVYDQVLGSIIAMLGIIGYFGTWIKIPILNISVSGQDFLLLKQIFTNDNSVDLLKYSFLIPASYILICFAAFVKSWFITFLTILMNLTMVGFILCLFVQKFNDIQSMISYGLYLLLLSQLLNLFFLYKITFKDLG